MCDGDGLERLRCGVKGSGDLLQRGAGPGGVGPHMRHMHPVSLKAVGKPVTTGGGEGETICRGYMDVDGGALTLNKGEIPLIGGAYIFIFPIRLAWVLMPIPKQYC